MVRGVGWEGEEIGAKTNYSSQVKENKRGSGENIRSEAGGRGFITKAGREEKEKEKSIIRRSLETSSPLGACTTASE